MSRKKEILDYIGDDKILLPLVDELIFLENQLDKLKTYPFISVNPKNPLQQKATAAQKQYKELLQQYTNIIKVLDKDLGEDETKESPLRAWFRKRAEENADKEQKGMDS